MKKNVECRRARLWALAGALLGAAVFLALYGTRVLNPTEVDWLLNGHGDPTQHYLGWVQYRHSEWHLPYLGMSYSTIYPPPGQCSVYRFPAAVRCLFQTAQPPAAGDFPVFRLVGPAVLHAAGFPWPVPDRPPGCCAHPLGPRGGSGRSRASCAVSCTAHPDVRAHRSGRHLADFSCSVRMGFL